MIEAARKVKACLSYGMVFTLLFEEAGVDLTNEIGKPLHHFDTYSFNSLKRMGYKLQEGIWIKKVSSQVAATSSEDDKATADEERSEGTMITPSDLKKLIYHKMETISSSLTDHMNSAIDEMKNTVNASL